MQQLIAVDSSKTLKSANYFEDKKCKHFFKFIF